MLLGLGRMGMGMPAAAGILLACAGMVLSACDSGTDATGKNGGVKAGYVANACGEADGPETQMILSDAALACGGSIFPQTSAYLRVPSIADLAVGPDSAYDNREAWHCADASDCADYGSLRVHFTDSTSTTLQGEYLIRKNGQTVEEGKFELRKCPVRPMCG